MMRVLPVLQAAADLKAAIAELRELARGIHPAVLTQAGLGPALTSLAERSTVAVVLENMPEGRLPAATESTAYFVVSEALTNVAKHANATKVTISARLADDELTVAITDDGAGGATDAEGSGLSGLRDRVASAGGSLSIVSPSGRGTTVRAVIPA
jgi:signal transduction histidine kinase